MKSTKAIEAQLNRMERAIHKMIAKDMKTHKEYEAMKRKLKKRGGR